jgi:hypothetical protein
MNQTHAIPAVLCLLVCAASPLPAQTVSGVALSSALPADPAELLGMSPAHAIERFGPPAKVFSVRGAEPWQDDVVFDYAGGFSLFLFKDRVWQIRIGEKHTAPVFGFVVGSAAERATAILGAPDLQLSGAYEWVLPAEAWPVRLRGIVDAAGSIRELYVYRADF